jgi:hypothetical protein
MYSCSKDMLSFFQVMHLKYHYPPSELQNLTLKAMEMLQGNGSIDPHALVIQLQFYSNEHRYIEFPFNSLLQEMSEKKKYLSYLMTN